MRCFRECNNELIEYLQSSNTHDGQFIAMHLPRLLDKYSEIRYDKIK